jgi:putative ABC transport system permease protein
VVGIVPETRYRDLRDPRPTVYFPLRQSFFPVVPMTLALRVDARASDLVPALRRTIGEVQPGVALASARSFATLLEAPRAQPRLNALLLATFTIGALVLAAIGLFAVMATMVRQRTRQLGVRMAIGATAGDVGGLVLRRGVALAAIGAALGIGGAIATNRLLGSMLFAVSPTDAVTLAIVTSVLMIVAGAASLIPARASTRIDPIIALRSE